MSEFFRIPNHPQYSIDKYGNVWSHYKNKIIRQTLRKGDTSYYKVGLLISSKPKKYKHLYIHQLLMLVFVGPCPKGMQVDHIDGNSLNNKLSNLRYVTPKQNTANRSLHGKHYTSFIKKINVKDVQDLVKAGLTYSSIACKLGTSERQISRLLSEKEI